MMEHFLVIQTAFIGDAILASSFVNLLKKFYPQAPIDIVVRKGNESLYHNHPQIQETLVWEKQISKTRNLLKIIKTVRKKKYSRVYNLQRFFSTGMMTAFSKAGATYGFRSNPLSLFFTHKISHRLGENSISGDNIALHEVQRNASLFYSFEKKGPLPASYELRPYLPVPSLMIEQTEQKLPFAKYVVLAPLSVWNTKQWPVSYWMELAFGIIKKRPDLKIVVIGGKADRQTLTEIFQGMPEDSLFIAAGLFNLLESKAIIEKSHRVFCNDSAAMHLASSADIPTTAIYCSTVPFFGFYPLASNSSSIQVAEELSCRPCGIHGKHQCPLKHFKCGKNIPVERVLATLEMR